MVLELINSAKSYNQTLPVAPVAPFRPGFPGLPVGPEGPAGPKGPEGPEGPGDPVAPVLPEAPVAPEKIKSWSLVILRRLKITGNWQTEVLRKHQNQLRT